jgi:hypothetical protein
MTGSVVPGTNEAHDLAAVENASAEGASLRRVAGNRCPEAGIAEEPSDFDR